MQSPAEISQDHDARGKFAPGNKAAPTTRLKRTPRSLLLECTSEAQVRRLVTNAFKLAEEGDTLWSIWLLNRVVPPLRATSPRIEFDLDVDNPGQAAKDILAAVGQGAISSDMAKDLIVSLESLNSIVQMSAMQEQIDGITAILDK